MLYVDINEEEVNGPIEIELVWPEPLLLELIIGQIEVFLEDTKIDLYLINQSIEAELEHNVIELEVINQPIEIALL